MEDRWNRLWSIFHAVRETPSDNRDDALSRLAAGDPALRDEVRELLRADAAGMNPLDALPAAARQAIQSPSLGEFVGRYKLMSMLGQGGMGVVYAAEQEEPVHRKAAVKILRSDFSGPREQARFEAEHQALAMLSHPNIAQVYDGGTANGHLFIAMEYVEGSVFNKACDEQKLPVRDRIRLFSQVCDAVQHAHQRGVIHRDLKPSNVLVTGAGDRAIPKVIDFGIAKGIGVRLSSESIQTRAGTLLGTPEYMSPEQAMSGDIDTRSDVYALGTMLYELVCGVLPLEFGNVDLMHALWMVAHEEPKTPSARFAALPNEEQERIAAARSTTPDDLLKALRGEVDWIAMKAIEKDPAARYASAGEFASDLGRYLADHPVLAGPPSGTYRLKKYIRRHRASAAAIAGVAAALFLGILGTGWMATVASRERDAAEVARDRATKDAAVAKATADFVKQMLAAPDPIAAGSGPGVRDVRVVDILDRAAKDLDHSMAQEPEVAAAFRHTLGQSYYGLGMYAAAKPLLERAIADRKRILGPDHPDTLSAQHDLAVTFRKTNEHAAAGKLILATYIARRRVLGQDHKETAASLFELANHYNSQGELVRAEKLYRDAINRFTRAEGPDSRGALMAMSSLSGILGNRGEIEEAERLARDSLARRRRAFGENHADTLSAKGNLVKILFESGRIDEATSIARERLEGEIALFGRDHLNTLSARNNVAVILVKAKRFDEAVTEFSEIIGIYDRTIGPEHEQALTARNNLAGTLSKAGRFEEAAAKYREFLPVAERVFAKKHGHLAMFKMGYAVTLASLGKRAEADRLLHASHRQMLETFGPKDARVKMAQARLAELRTTGQITKTR